MSKVSTIFLLAGVALAMAAQAARAQANIDMSRYESIHEAPKAARARPTSPTTSQGIQPSKRVETIGPSTSEFIGRSNGLGMSEAPQPMVRPTVRMTAGGTVFVAPGIVDRVPPQAASNADMPAPKQRTTEMITEDAKGEVIERSTVFR